jgi:serpin B
MKTLTCGFGKAHERPFQPNYRGENGRSVMKFLFRISAILIVIVSVSGCSEEVTCPANDTQPHSTPTSLALRIDRTNDFALDLYHQLRSADDAADNLIVSPHSIVTNWGMVYAGARGQTEREIADVFHFNYPQVDFHARMKQLNDLLESRGSTAGPEAFKLDIANSAWADAHMTFLQSYLDTIATDYGAPVQTVDFRGQPEACRLLINEWVADQTDDLILDLIAPGAIDPFTVLVLVNTIYFRAGWLDKFDPSYTSPGTFTKLDASQVTVPIMSGEFSVRYHEGAGYDAVELPYKGEECSMVLILPDEGEFANIESALNASVLDTVVSSLSYGWEVIVKLPKFSFETKYDLVSALEAMGISAAFHPGADFSGIDGSDDGQPWVSFVAHKSFISVDEWGTLAAAGTATGFTVGETFHFYAVRPFLFLIRDNETGSILFLGRVLDPSA